ncbi:PREDICTED: ubiquinol-cytochrome-c reductase complex assembly factor 1-like [Nanorana parkeri]|uniref:ubiquinol-cytochrome-c reductase complex assembly factor 1-like n=1 Tax=Nanorana parkeri TaxID=125878 RepID=UPI000854DFFA|nr:PREDICTED: ubiquinol-cytochrome-c reductase complex assembly factor 1-like [Nanorana parkeri]
MRSSHLPRGVHREHRSAIVLRLLEEEPGPPDVKKKVHRVVQCRGRILHTANLVDLGIDSVTMKKTMNAFTEIFYASIFGYDEGIISDDRVLAAALWRNLFNIRCDDPRQLELMVEYVRKQMQYLDSQNGEDLLLTGEVTWRPLVENDPQSILKPSSPTYNDEGL